MTIRKEEDFKKEAVLAVAEKICLAARSAPKGKGLDLLEIAVTGNTNNQRRENERRDD